MNDDLVQLFAAAPEQPSQDVRFRQGVIVTFDQVTLENTVLVGGTILTNLPLQGVGEATLLVPGSVVGIMAVGGAAKTMYITGRIVIPNTDDAADAISLLNSQIFSDFVYPAGESTASTTYTDLATVGPRVTVPVGPSGRILIIATAQMQWTSTNAAATSADGRFDVEFTGANTRTPNEVVDPLVGAFKIALNTSAGTNQHAAISSATTQAVFSSLNPGNTVITMKYRNPNGASQVTDFHRRGLTVIKL